MNINMPPFVLREQRGCRVVSNLLQGEGDRVETFPELMPVAELHVSLHVAEVEAMERRYALREGVSRANSKKTCVTRKSPEIRLNIRAASSIVHAAIAPARILDGSCSENVKLVMHSLLFFCIIDRRDLRASICGVR